MSAKDILLCVIIPLLIAELGPWCGWLAGKLLLWAAALRYGDGDRAAVRAEEWSEHLCEIPGQLSKLVYSLGQLTMGSAVAARRAIGRVPATKSNSSDSGWYWWLVNVRDLPGIVSESLMPNEQVVTRVRMHPIAIIRPAFLILADMMGVGFVTGIGVGAFTKIVWILWFALFVWQGQKLVNWWRRCFVVTENRLMLVSGIFDQDIGIMPLAEVTDIRLHLSTAGRTFGYGEFIVESAGQKQALSYVPFLPYPMEMYQEMLALTFPRKAPPSGTSGI
jgi:hypothetical protein